MWNVHKSFLIMKDSENRNGTLLTRSYCNWNPEDHGATLVWRDVSVYAKLRQQKTIKRLVNSGKCI